MQTTQKFQETRDTSDTIIESCTAILRADDLASIRDEFNAKKKSSLYTATSRFCAVVELIGLSIAIILLVPLLLLKFGFILIFK